MNSDAPRLFGIVASDAPIVAVIRRGPTNWTHVSRWNTNEGTIEHGAWLHGTIAPQKCDLSPDGVWLLYSATNYSARWPGGQVYEAISRLPWLKALVVWNAGTTYTRGAHFVDDTGRNDLGEPSAGELGLEKYGVAITPADQFAVERRRGWTESSDSADRGTGGAWDEERTVAMVRTSPIGDATLRVEGDFAAFRSLRNWRSPPTYSLVWANEEQPLDVQWADWSHDGKLLAADDGGRLGAYRVEGRTLHAEYRHDLAQLTPNPQPPPATAEQW